MKLLIIGGTRFVGRAIVEEAMARGHELTLFHRGQSNPDLFQVEQIFGDRDGELDKLSGRAWDAVIDTCGYFPRVVDASCEALRDRVGLYCFISTISVYEDKQPEPISESARLRRFEKMPEAEEITVDTYGAFKVLCEEAVQLAFPGKALIVRPGLIMGPHDRTDRMTYWIDRFSRPGPVLVPDRASQMLQAIDARDLAAFTVSLVEQGVAGVFNATGIAMTMEEIWGICRRVGGDVAHAVTVPHSFQEEHGIQYWADLPLTMPEGEMFDVADISKAQAAGLKLRPFEESITDTLAWHRIRGDEELKTGLSRERERELLAQVGA